MKITWPHVAIVGLLLTAIVILGAFGRDTTALLALGSLLLAGIGLTLGQTTAVKEQTNGNMSRLLALVEKQGQLLATMQPSPNGAIPGEVVGEVVDTPKGDTTA